MVKEAIPVEANQVNKDFSIIFYRYLQNISFEVGSSAAHRGPTVGGIEPRNSELGDPVDSSFNQLSHIARLSWFRDKFLIFAHV